MSSRTTRSRNKNGRFRKKRSDAHLKGLEKTYGEMSPKRSDTHLGTLRQVALEDGQLRAQLRCGPG